MSQACCQTALKIPRFHLNSARLKKKGQNTQRDKHGWVHTPSHFVTHTTNFRGETAEDWEGSNCAAFHKNLDSKRSCHDSHAVYVCGGSFCSCGLFQASKALVNCWQTRWSWCDFISFHSQMETQLAPGHNSLIKHILLVLHGKLWNISFAKIPLLGL